MLRVFHIGGVGLVCLGKVGSGRITIGMRLFVSPEDMCVNVKSIRKHEQEVTEACAGDFITFSLENAFPFTYVPLQISRGALLGDVFSSPPKRVASFVARILRLTFGCRKMKSSYNTVMQIHTATIPCTVAQIVRLVDRRTMKTLAEYPEKCKVKMNQVADVLLVPLKPVSVEISTKFHCYGKFNLLEGKHLFAVGVVLQRNEYVPNLPRWRYVKLFLVSFVKDEESFFFHTKISLYILQLILEYVAERTIPQLSVSLYMGRTNKKIN